MAISKEQVAKMQAGRKKKVKSDSQAPVETKIDKFRRLANARVNKAVKIINQVGNLSTSQYECTKEQREVIFAALDNAIESMKIRFEIKQDVHFKGVSL